MRDRQTGVPEESSGTDSRGLDRSPVRVAGGWAGGVSAVPTRARTGPQELSGAVGDLTLADGPPFGAMRVAGDVSR